MSTAWNWVQTKNGQDTESSYPYTATDPHCNQTTGVCVYGSTQPYCKYNAANKGATNTGVVNLPPGDEIALMSTIVNIGPVSAAIDATKLSLYSSGIYSCTSPPTINHGVVIVGYGTNSNGTAYWTVRNSWGQNWGINGYFMIQRNLNSTCGIANYTMYPTV